VEHFLDKGDSAYERESFLAAGRYYSRAFAVNCRKLTQHEFYKAATSYAQAGAMDSAFLFFDRFLNRFNYFEYGQLQQDSNLIRLWKDPRWAVLVDRVRTNFARAEEHFNKPVKMELDTIYEDDQKYRRGIEEAEKKYGFNSQQAEALEDKMVWQDSINLSKVVSILDRYGWLGPDSVGFHGSFTLFIVLQHADLETQQKYLPIMRLAVKAGSARASDLAYLEDRVALDEGKKQIYGSQVRYNPKTGKYAFAPIRDEKNVNVRRRKVGLEPLETYAHSYNIQYKVPTN
jgi:hypothetical protein